MHIKKTFSDESENPPATNDPSWDIDEQLKLRQLTKILALSDRSRT
jgi:hypothetical protein